MNLEPVLIIDDRLSPDMRRVRAGSTMQFYKPENRSLQSDDADVYLVAPKQELSAELIDQKWFWVNDCPECNGKIPQWAYKKCEKHDVCVTCRKPRSEFKEAVWGHQEGFRCKSCQEAVDEAVKQEALEKVAAKEYDEWDYRLTDEVLCPHCGTEHEPEYEDGGERECHLCGGKFSLEVNQSVTYSTEIIGSRVKLSTKLFTG